MSDNNFKDLLKPLLVPIHSEGWIFIAIFALISFILIVFIGWFWPFGVALTLWCAYFFRDPKRVVPQDKSLVISPADGVVQSISHDNPPPELAMEAGNGWTRIAIFMNVFDVHVNRTPIDGTIVRMAYRPGKFLSANLDKASEENERQAYRLIHQHSQVELGMVQIAGLVARRILVEVNEGDNLRAGQRIGMIRFGSRVDVYLPQPIAPQVCVGQRMIAGETILAKLPLASASDIDNPDWQTARVGVAL